MQDKEKLQISTFEKIEQENVLYFCLEMNHQSITKIVADSFSVDRLIAAAVVQMSVY